MQHIKFHFSKMHTFAFVDVQELIRKNSEQNAKTKIIYSHLFVHKNYLIYSDFKFSINKYLWQQNKKKTLIYERKCK